MTQWYWRQRGGTLIHEFPAVRRAACQGQRLLDGVIILNGEHREAIPSEVSLKNKDIVIVQTKNSRLGMYLMGQAFFSMDLMRSFEPRSIESIALCAVDDAILRPIFERHSGCQVVVCPPEVCCLSRKIV